MKVYEALEILAHLDPLEEVTITFGKAKRIADDWNKNRNHQVMNKNWWLNPTSTITYDNDRMH